MASPAAARFVPGGPGRPCTGNVTLTESLLLVRLSSLALLLILAAGADTDGIDGCLAVGRQALEQADHQDGQVPVVYGF